VPDGVVQQAEQQLVERFIEALESQRRLLRAALSDSWSDVEEANFVPNALKLDLIPQTDNEFRVDFILAYAGVAAGNAGLIELGDADRPHQIVVPAGPPGIAPQVKIRLKNTSRRRISSVTIAGNVPGAPSSGPAGFLYLALFGKEVPLGGIQW
jgi:hypothetical protein